LDFVGWNYEASDPKGDKCFQEFGLNAFGDANGKRGILLTANLGSVFKGGDDGAVVHIVFAG
jgi:hypothetical protein